MIKFLKKKTSANPYSNKSDAELLEINRTKCSWPNTYYGNIDTLARLISAKNLLEIGVAYGYHAEHLLRNLPTVKYTGIDPYIANYDLNDSFSQDVSELFNSTPQDSMNRLYLAVNNNLIHTYPDRAKILRVKSLDVKISQNYDLIFLDGDHRYENVVQELNKFFPLIRRGGILAGDDYTWPGVKKAVDEFSKSKSLAVHFISRVSEGYPTYFIVKP